MSLTFDNTFIFILAEGRWFGEQRPATVTFNGINKDTACDGVEHFFIKDVRNDEADVDDEDDDDDEEGRRRSRRTI